MSAESMAPFGMALLDYLEGDASAAITVRRDDGFAAHLPIAVFFRDPAELPIDRAALDACRDPVLDIGAGAGIHTLALQERGVEATAIDIAPGAVEVMRRRGVRDARQADVYEFAGGRFRSLLLLQHGVGMAGTLEGLDRLLGKLKDLLADDGEVLCDSLDVRRTEDERHLAYQEANRAAGRYIGEIRTRIDYGQHEGRWSGWLHVDPETLARHAGDAGYSCDVILQLDTGDYLARLRPR